MIAKQGDLLKVMPKKELVMIKTYASESGGKVYVISQSIKGLSLYEKSKAINHFIEKETKVLETCIDNDLRQVLISYGIIPQDGTQQALERAFTELELKGVSINIYDRYNKLDNEYIVGAKNFMTIINEDDELSCAIEVEVVKNE